MLRSDSGQYVAIFWGCLRNTVRSFADIFVAAAYTCKVIEYPDAQLAVGNTSGFQAKDSHV